MVNTKKGRGTSSRGMKLRKGDEVLVIAGNDKGTKGTVRTIIRAKGRVIVEGVNLRWKHKRASQQDPQGAERVQEECAIHASNVMRIDPTTGKPTRKRQAKSTK